MASRVFMHIGLPKTGTTYLQDVVWSNQEALRRAGLSVPGRGHREHLWAALEVLERDLSRRHPRAHGAWERLCAEIDEAAHDVLITHEFFCAASREQAERVVGRLAPAEVHLIITARHSAAMLGAGWQEMVKNGGEADLESVAGRRRSRSEFSWRTWDLHGVLERWGDVVPPSRVHILPVPDRSQPVDQHWHNFRTVLGLADDYAPPAKAANQSLGAVQVELLRRVNAHLGEFKTSADRGRWIRGYLAERHLVTQAGERFGLPDDLVADSRRRSERAVQLISERGFHVVGDPSSLLVPDELTTGRPLGEVTDAEMLGAATSLIAAMLADVRDLSERSVPERTPVAVGGGRSRAVSAIGRLLRKARGVGRADAHA